MATSQPQQTPVYMTVPQQQQPAAAQKKGMFGKVTDSISSHSTLVLFIIVILVIIIVYMLCKNSKLFGCKKAAQTAEKSDKKPTAAGEGSDKDIDKVIDALNKQ